MCSTKCPSQTFTHSSSSFTTVADSSSSNGEPMCSQQTLHCNYSAVYVLSRNKANGVYMFGFSANHCHYCCYYCPSLCLARFISPKLLGSITLYTHSTGLLALLRLQPHTIYKKICTRFCAISTTFLFHCYCGQFSPRTAPTLVQNMFCLFARKSKLFAGGFLSRKRKFPSRLWIK